ncbi:MAG TPA: glycoside hydrolase family 97 catalytic domain-containing protein [Candidatus Paceibacterota bacterium]|nr:glycoside hydrolase family 97 catalytic domain-containing protein [Candidatus Paceibacterota bacterium]
MKRILLLILTMSSTCLLRAETIPSPDGKLEVEFKLNPVGAPVYRILQHGKTVLQESRLGLVRDDADFTKELKLVSASKQENVKDDYEILTAKRRVNAYRAKRKVFHLATAGGQKMDITFQVSNDGVAFRYFFPDKSEQTRKLSEEMTSFHFLPGTKAWLQPMAVAKSGWCESNPSYEEYYEKEIPVGTPSKLGAGWIYPALFRSDDVWLLVSEVSVPRNYCATRLRSESPDGEYSVGFADPREVTPGGAGNPESKLPWLSPWRIVVVGTLKTIAESTLGIDVADKPAVKPAATIEPGKASWSWPLLGDGETKYDTQKRFIDYAADMGWRYCLIDALWDQQIGYDKVKELIDYARGKNVKILLWYNSAGSWNSTPQTPRNLMFSRESRIKEFERLKQMGVAGLKIDFFGGDGQSMINYYHDLLTDSAPYGFLMNFHGATLPRGWERTYPHLMTMEAIRGFEFITFEQANADQEPSHAAMLPFTRNVFDPMDFTPVCLDKIGRVTRRTTSAFELALSVLFVSGIQHYPETPEGMAKMPAFVRDFMRHVPSVWDDSKFIDGFPGKWAVIARKGRNEKRWYVAGINGEATARKLTLNLKSLSPGKTASLITDGNGQLFEQRTVALASDKKLELSLPPNGGFVLRLE